MFIQVNPFRFRYPQPHEVHKEDIWREPVEPYRCPIEPKPLPLVPGKVTPLKPYKFPPTFPEQKPHLCPVCHGRGVVEEDFYLGNGNANLVKCKACNGKGIIIT